MWFFRSVMPWFYYTDTQFREKMMMRMMILMMKIMMVVVVLTRRNVDNFEFSIMKLTHLENPLVEFTVRCVNYDIVCVCVFDETHN